MAKIFQLVYLCIFVAWLCECSTGLWSNPLRRWCNRRIFRRFRHRLCRKPVIPGIPATMKPNTLPPTTSRPLRVYNPPKTHSSGLPFCTTRDINAILNPTGRRTKRTTSWPFDCQFASILQRSGTYQFVFPIYDCCSKCSFPTFTTCVANSQGKNVPSWKCPSDGLHCIVGCVNKHHPDKITSISSSSKQSSILKPVLKPDKTSTTQIKTVKPVLKPDKTSTTQIKPVKPVLNKCEKLDVEKGRKCVRKLCVTLDFKP